MKFTVNWTSRNLPIFDACIPIGDAAPRSVLEIGCYEGRTTALLCERYLAPGGTIVCVDPYSYDDGRKRNGLPTFRSDIDIPATARNRRNATWDMPRIRSRFEANVGELQRRGFDVQHRAAPSAEVLMEWSLQNRRSVNGVPPRLFDLVYVDGCHLAASCLTDLVLAMDVVRPGSVLIVDDYAGANETGRDETEENVLLACQSFRSAFENRLETLRASRPSFAVRVIR